MYEIVITKSAERELKKLPLKIYQEVRTLIFSLAENQRPYGVETMTNYGKGRHYRVRTGDYRVIYQVHDETITVEIVKVGHRREIYK
jgi:mRNA interferase RelE/StbE